MKKLQVISVIFFLFLLAGMVFYYFVFKKLIKQKPFETKIAHVECLEDNEVAILRFIGEEDKATSADVIVNDKISNKEKLHFQIDNLPSRRGYDYELHKCGIYVIRQLPGDYKIELWQYDFSGGSKKILTMAEKDAEGKKILVYFNYDFRVDPQEQYVVLERSYSAKEDYALIFKDFKLNIDKFELLRKSLYQTNPEFTGDFGLKDWTKNGSYFWARLFSGAYTDAFLRIKRDSWKVEVLPAPDGVLGGTALNAEKGYVTQLPGHVWTGIDIVTEETKKEWIKEGKISQLYIFNLLDQKRILLATTSEPLWNFETHWLSDTELQYEMPSGEKKIYKISEK